MLVNRLEGSAVQTSRLSWSYRLSRITAALAEPKIKAIRMTTTWTFRYELSGANATNYTLNALVLHEKEIELYRESNKLLIKA